jgi:phosphoglucosamine mutase
MTPEIILRLGQAAAVYLTQQSQSRRGIVIGKDTRLSGYIFETVLASGICSMGNNVYLAGPLPTSGVSFLTRKLHLDGGIVISASHNPYYDNGIKFFKSDGFKLSDEAEEAIEKWMEGDLESRRVSSSQIGKAFRVNDAVGQYVSFLKSTFPTGRDLKSLKVVIDCAHGAAYRVAPQVFEELGATVIKMGVEPNGKNINEGCGALAPAGLVGRVVEEGAHVGMGLDGDADRVVFVDEKGKVHEGDEVLMLCALELQKKGGLNHNAVVTTVMSNMGLELALAPHGIQVLRTCVGDRYLSNEMIRRGCNLGAESSGHFLFLDYNTTCDGIIAALQVLAILTEHQKPLSELLSGFVRLPQVLTNVSVKTRRDFNEVIPIKQAIQSAQDRLSGRGRIFVRFSGTEPLVRILVEGEREEEIHAIAKEVADTFQKHLGA